MANLGTFTISGNSYVDLETATGITLTTTGTTYSVQSHDNDFYFREGSEGEGVSVPARTLVTFEPSGTSYYVKPIVGAVKLNIAN